MADSKRGKKELGGETAGKLQWAMDSLAAVESDAEYNAIVQVVWRGLTLAERLLLADTLDDETGPWRVLSDLSEVQKAVESTETQGGYIPEYLSKSSRNGTGLRYEVERLRLQRFLQSVDFADAQDRNRQQGYKK